jgi:ribokinase
MADSQHGRRKKIMKAPKILVVGSLVMDLIYSTSKVPNEGETVNDGLSFTSAPGGKGANQAVQAARLGIDVTMVGKVGEDMFGDGLLKVIQEAGINTDNILRDKTCSSAVSNIILEVVPGRKTKNRIIVVPGSNMKLTVDDVAFLKDTVSEYDLVIIQLEIPLEVNRKVIEYAYAKGVPVMLNSAPYQPLDDELLSRLTYISPNEHEAYGLTGIKTTKDDGSIDIEKVELAAKALLNKGVKNVIITLGSNGVAFMNNDTFVVKPCIDIVKVVDPTAAGDSFTGAFCSATCLGMTAEKALDFANYTATLTVSKMGAITSLPTLEEVKDLMKKNNYSEN